jgi:uncharacterized membrane-anchored protein
MTDSEPQRVAPASPKSEPSDGWLSKVPQVTVFFWLIKVLCTTVGETASDFLSENLGFGLKGTSVAAGVALAVVLLFQFRAKKYVPAIYWLAVVLISVFGTLITDILTDSLGFPLEASTVIFSVALGITFAAWYAKEGTLSIHSIFTARREVFYWLAILFTFALGTATGDLMAEKLGLGYATTGLVVLGVVVAAGIAWNLGLDSVLAFWIAYILTRPLGASLGDYLSQPRAAGGLGLGPTITSAGFLTAILTVVVYLSVTRRDFIAEPPRAQPTKKEGSSVGRQVAAVVALLLILGGTGYSVRRGQLQKRAAESSSPTAPLGDVSAFRKIATDMLAFVKSSDMGGAKTRAGDLETAWDDGQARMRPMNPDKWTVMDAAIDDVLTKVRAGKSGSECAASLEALLSVIDNLGAQPSQPTAPSAASATASASAAASSSPSHAHAAPLGDLSAFKKIPEDILGSVRAGDAARAKARARDLEKSWDDAQARLQPMNPTKWAQMDDAIDDVLKKVRSASSGSAASLESLLALVHSLDSRD